jgi:translation initiation factor IF-3
VPIPRRFDRRPPERDQTRINERIRVPEVRLIGDDGKQVGVVKTDQALRYAQERDLDLVEVAPEARPPVVRVLDYSKYKYEQEQKAKAARRHQKQITIREIKLRPKIATADYETKKGHVRRFLGGQDKVKITIMFRGRETTHPERGEQLLMRLAEDVADLGTIEQRPNLDGRNMTMVLGPVKAREAGEGDQPKPHEPSGGGKDSRRNRAAAAGSGQSPHGEEPAQESDAGSAPDTAAESAPDTAAESAPDTAAESEPEAAEQAEVRRSA